MLNFGYITTIANSLTRLSVLDWRAIWRSINSQQQWELCQIGSYDFVTKTWIWCGKYTLCFRNHYRRCFRTSLFVQHSFLRGCPIINSNIGYLQDPSFCRLNSLPWDSTSWIFLSRRQYHILRNLSNSIANFAAKLQHTESLRIKTASCRCNKSLGSTCMTLI